MRILVTGGTGFIGGRIAARLLSFGHEVLVGTRNIRTCYLQSELQSATLVQTDWDEESSLLSLCKDVDIVIHAAGMNAADCHADPIAALAFNGDVTASLVAVAVKACVKKFFYFSTVHVYSSPLAGRITEDTITVNKHPYATSHLSGENAILETTENTATQGLVLRLSNVFGVPINVKVNCWMLLVNDLCRQAVETHTMCLNSSGRQLRDFIALKEVCQIVQHLAEVSSDRKHNRILNIASGQSMSVMAMSQLIQARAREVLGFEPELILPKVTDVRETRYKNLEINREKLNGICSIMPSDPSCEIDQLLSFCNKYFKYKESTQHAPL